MVYRRFQGQRESDAEGLHCIRKTFLFVCCYFISRHPALTWQQAWNESSDSTPARHVRELMKQTNIPHNQRSLFEWISKPTKKDSCTLTISHLPQVNIMGLTLCFIINDYAIKLYESTVSIPPPRQPSDRVLASSAGGPGFNPQSRTASYQRRYKNGTSSALVQH